MQLTPRDEAIWYVLQRITNNIANAQSVQLGIYQYSRNSANGSPSMSRQLDALQSLQQQGVITFVDQPRCELYLEGDGPEYAYVYDLSIKNVAKLNELYEHHKKLEQQQADSQPISLSYDPVAGIGLINGSRELKLRGKNKQVFNQLYKEANGWVGRMTILKAARYKHDLRSKQATIDHNTLITNLRRATGLTPQHIIVHDGQAMLRATITS